MTVFISFITILFLLIPAGISAVNTLTGYSGHSVQIRCPYESGYETYLKYLCRGECSTLHWGNKDIVIESGSSAKDQRFSLEDDTAARVFTITITDLRAGDEGQYWCGIRRPYTTNIYTEILLLVKNGDPTSITVPLTTYITTPEPIQPTALPLTDSTAYVTLSLPEQKHSSTMIIPGPGVVYVVVSLLVLAVALGVLVFFCKRRKNRDAVASDRSQAGVGGVRDEVDYENDPPRNQNSMPMTPVYQSLNPNTNQSDSIYQTLNPNTNQSDSVYQTLNPNTNQSDSVYQSLNPNTNQSDSVYQSLNPTPTNQIQSTRVLTPTPTNQIQSTRA